ncbi:hypothetical protein DPMN_102414 [Dreissena polymorpha]|uniref:Uncharacterized protein n=1 Tax=Dreissena polymorpha TaxID=45954 RepID=A0A9D4LJ07_DREPO|nr:hypothetical protein DPMN_102414 [Dreissena polymorpha]
MWILCGPYVDPVLTMSEYRHFFPQYLLDSRKLVRLLNYSCNFQLLSVYANIFLILMWSYVVVGGQNTRTKPQKPNRPERQSDLNGHPSQTSFAGVGEGVTKSAYRINTGGLCKRRTDGGDVICTKHFYDVRSIGGR